MVSDGALRRYALARGSLVASSAALIVIGGGAQAVWLGLAVALAIVSVVPVLVPMGSGARTIAVGGVDIVIPILMTSRTGGDASPFMLFGYVGVVLIGANLRLRAALLAAGAGSVALWLTIAVPHIRPSGIAPDVLVRVSTASACLFLVAILASYLGESFRRRTAEADPLRDRLVQVGQLSAVLVHELRNIMKPLSGAVELLEGDLGPADSHEPLMRLIREECQSMESFLGEFLDFTSSRPIELEPIDLGDLLDGVVETIRRHPDAGDAVIEVDTTSLLGPIDANAPSLRRMFVNVVLNAVQAAPQGTVVVHGVNDGDDAVVRVEDEGPGVSEERREAIFEPFHTTRGGGTGLGLAVVRRTVERHGGEVRVGDGQRGGARFEIRLPRHPLPERAAA